MPSSQRSADPVKQVRRLEERHTDLKRRVAELEGRTHLSDHERLEVQHLKKRKLATKDALLAMRARA